jgi:HK97 gp10 family phage protein
MPERIEIKGIKEFQQSLRKMDSDLPKQLRIALNQASQLVIDKARPQIPTRSGAARASLKVRSSQREARVAAGGRKAPYYPWLDFGGKVGRNRSVSRPFYKEGRYIYPALRKNRDEITKVMVTAINDLARGAGLEVT